jgi:hypothetical protein
MIEVVIGDNQYIHRNNPPVLSDTNVDFEIEGAIDSIIGHNGSTGSAFDCYRQRLGHNYGVDFVSKFRNFHDIYIDLFGFDNFSREAEILRLFYSGKEAGLLSGVVFDFPEIDSKQEPLRLIGKFSPGIWEGNIEFQFYLKRPQYMSEGVFAVRDVNNQTIADYIGEEIPLWAVRMTPDNIPGLEQPMCIGATQRIISQYNSHSIMDYAGLYNRNLKPKLGNQNNFTDIFKEFFKIRQHEFGKLVFPKPVLEFKYLYHGLPGNHLIDKIERSLDTKMEDFTLVTTIQVLQFLGYKNIRMTDMAHNTSLSLHRQWSPIQESIDIDKLCQTYFEYQPDQNWAKYPYHLHHTGRDLGLTPVGLKSMSPVLKSFGLKVSERLLGNRKYVGSGKPR